MLGEGVSEQCVRRGCVCVYACVCVYCVVCMCSVSFLIAGAMFSPNGVISVSASTFVNCSATTEGGNVIVSFSYLFQYFFSFIHAQILFLFLFFVF